MWKVLKTIVGAAVGGLGFVLLFPWRVLDVVGRILTARDMGNTYDAIIDWIAAHPRIAVDLGPWFLMTAGIGSIALTHLDSLRQLYYSFFGTAESPHLAPAAELPLAIERGPLTLRQIFDSDFDGLARIFTIQSASIYGSIAVEFPATEYLDIHTNSYFMAFYLSRQQDVMALSSLISSALGAISSNLGQVEFEATISGDTRRFSNSTMKFSGQVYLYLEDDLSISEMSKIESLFDTANCHVHIRSSAYHLLHWKEFDRVPHSAEDAGGMGVQLPKVKIGDFVTIRNRTGSLPPTTIVRPVESPPSPAQPT